MKCLVLSSHAFLFIAVVVGSSCSSIGFAQQEDKEEEYSFAFKWGSNGTGNGQFMRPHGIDFDSKGNVYVTDRDLNNVQKFTSDGKFILKWGKNGTEEGEFIYPYSVVIDKSDNVYVVDKDNNRIQKFYSNGTFIQKWGPIHAPGSLDAFNKPEAMAIDPTSGNIFITDTFNNRIVKVDSDFNFILDWGQNGTDEGDFNHPHGIGVDSSGNVYVNELNAARIQKFDSDGNFIKQWGSEGTGNGEFTLALEHLFVDTSSDTVWQVDGEGNPRIQKFDNDGNFITSVGSGPCIIPDEVKNNEVEMAKYSECDGKLHQPEHANLDSLGNLYVVDRGNQRIEVFTPVK